MGNDEMLRWLDAQDQKRKAEMRRFIGGKADDLKVHHVTALSERLFEVLEHEDAEEAVTALRSVSARVIMERSTTTDELQHKYDAFVDTLGRCIEGNLKTWNQELKKLKNEPAA